MRDENTTSGLLLLNDQVVTWREVEELGLEEAPVDVGPSLVEIEDLERRRADQ